MAGTVIVCTADPRTVQQVEHGDALGPLLVHVAHVVKPARFDDRTVWSSNPSERQSDRHWESWAGQRLIEPLRVRPHRSTNSHAGALSRHGYGSKVCDRPKSGLMRFCTQEDRAADVLPGHRFVGPPQSIPQVRHEQLEQIQPQHVRSVEACTIKTSDA